MKSCIFLPRQQNKLKCRYVRDVTPGRVFGAYMEQQKLGLWNQNVFPPAAEFRHISVRFPSTQIALECLFHADLEKWCISGRRQWLTGTRHPHKGGANHITHAPKWTSSITSVVKNAKNGPTPNGRGVVPVRTFACMHWFGF